MWAILVKGTAPHRLSLPRAHRRCMRRTRSCNVLTSQDGQRHLPHCAPAPITANHHERCSVCSRRCGGAHIYMHACAPSKHVQELLNGLPADGAWRLLFQPLAAVLAQAQVDALAVLRAHSGRWGGWNKANKSGSPFIATTPEAGLSSGRRITQCTSYVDDDSISMQVTTAGFSGRSASVQLVVLLYTQGFCLAGKATSIDHNRQHPGCLTPSIKRLKERTKTGLGRRSKSKGRGRLVCTCPNVSDARTWRLCGQAGTPHRMLCDGPVHRNISNAQTWHMRGHLSISSFSLAILRQACTGTRACVRACQCHGMFRLLPCSCARLRGALLLNTCTPMNGKPLTWYAQIVAVLACTPMRCPVVELVYTHEMPGC